MKTPPKVVFVDWHGVLCHDVFWQSIRGNPHHALNPPLTREMANLMGGRDRWLWEEWLRGQVTSKVMCRDLTRRMGYILPADALLRQLYCGIGSMHFEHQVWQGLRDEFPDALMVIASDNIDMFAQYYADMRNKNIIVRQIAPWLTQTFRAAALRCDALLCSSERGVLKGMHPGRFFGPWLHQMGLTFEDALLVDDSPTNCREFFKMGGRARLWAPEHATLEAQGLIKPFRLD